MTQLVQSLEANFHELLALSNKAEDSDIIIVQHCMGAEDAISEIFGKLLRLYQQQSINSTFELESNLSGIVVTMVPAN